MQNRYFPFYDLGFRCNPFRAVTDEEWAELAIVPEHTAAAFARGTHLQLLGPAGHGKTSLLLGLAAQLTQQGLQVRYEYIPAGQHRFQTIASPLDALLIDEAQRLSPIQRVRMLRLPRAGTRLLLGSHEDLSQLFVRRRLPLIILDLSTPSPAHVQAVLERRIAYFALPDGPRVELSSDAVGYLYSSFGGNLRAIQWFLYEVFQTWNQPGMLTAEQLYAARSQH